MSATIERDEYNEEAHVGDIVKIAGYGDYEFEVISITREHFADRTIEYSYTYYETLSVEDGRNYYADEGEVSIVKRALRRKGEVPVDPGRVDDLLTELYDYYTLVGIVGDDYEEGDKKYVDRIAEIKAELTELTKEG